MQFTQIHLLRNRILYVAIILMLCGCSEIIVAQPKPIIATTGDPHLIESGSAGLLTPMTEAAYLEYAPKLAARMAAFVPMKKKPEKLSPQAMFGINFSYAGHNRTWILDGDDKVGFTFYVDLNANGDLSDDPPRKIEIKEGKGSTLYEITAKDPKTEETFPVVMKIVVDTAELYAKDEHERWIRQYENTEREGKLQDGNQSILFNLNGTNGVYNERHNRVSFDLDGDGKLDPRTERYFVWEQFVNIGDTSYEFAIDRYGKQITLTPLANKLPPRASLLTGTLAPDFTFTNLDGKVRKLSEYRGKVVLLNFWGTWCGPCVASAPKLVVLYDKYHARGFEILNIALHDSAEDIRQFNKEHKITWPQMREENEQGATLRLYRVMSWPSYYLLDQEGKILKPPIEARKLEFEAELEKLLDAPKPNSPIK